MSRGFYPGFVVAVFVLGMASDQALAFGRRARQQCATATPVACAPCSLANPCQLPVCGLDPEEMWICGFNVPPGWVAVQYGYLYQCGGSMMYNNATLIRKLPSRDLPPGWICGFTAPAGHVITQVGWLPQCGGNTTYNASYTELPRDGMCICGIKAPPGYTITQIGYRPQCGWQAPGDPSINSVQIRKLP